MESKIVIYALDAGTGDCILIVDTKTNKRILVDSGPAMGRGKSIVDAQLPKILGSDNKIDLAIVTHNDNDHIGGFKSLLEKQIITVEKFLFNDFSTVSRVIPDKYGKISFKQDVDLAEYLSQNSVDSDLIIVDAQYKNTMRLGSMKLTFLSPSVSALNKLKDAGSKRLNKISAGTSTSTQTVVDCLEDIASGKDKFETDLSPTNRSSISFKLDVEGLSFLFLADINAEEVEAFLHSHKEQTSFRLVKLSHHGSVKNTRAC